MAEITDDDYWLEPSRTVDEMRKSNEEHRELCEKNKKEMTPEEYKQWIDFFD